MNSTIQWATLKFDPGEPRTSNPEWQPQHSALVVMANGEEIRIYFNPGIYSALRKGDAVMLEYAKGKWRMAKTQTPELMQTLAARQHGNVAATSEPAPTDPPPANGEDDIKTIAEIYNRLSDLIDAPPEVISSLACTVFISRRKR